MNSSLSRPAEFDRESVMRKLRGRKVIVVLGWFAMGGAERQGFLLARELQKRGVQVEVWGFYGGRGRAQCRAWNIKARQLAWPLSRGRVRNMARLAGLGLRLRMARADFIVPYTTIASTLVCAGWRVSGARACVWNQRDEGRDIHGKGSPLQRFAVRQASLVLANSQHAAQMMRERFDLPAHAVETVKNGIEVSPPTQTRAQFRAHWNIEPKALCVVMVANLHQNKDHVTLLDAWSEVLGKWRASQPEKPAPVLLLAGREDDTARALHAQSERLQLGEHARFLGDVRDIGALFEASDVAVHSSLREGTPNAVLEAMACGLPLVGTDIPGIREALGIEENALLNEEQRLQLAPPQNAPVLAERIGHLLADAALRQRLGTQNRTHIQMHWSPESMCDQFCEILARFA